MTFFMRTFAAGLSVLAGIAAGIAPASAAQHHTDGASGTTGFSGASTKAYPSALTTTYTVSGTNLQIVANNPPLTTLGGATAAMFTPPVPTSTTGIQLQAVGAGCSFANNAATTVACPTLGTLRIDFNRPVTNPVLHVVGLGSVRSITGDTVTITAGRATHAIAASTPAGATMTVLPGAVNLQTTNGGLAFDLIDANYNGTNCSTVTAPATQLAGCGSVRINGTVTSVTLDVGLSGARNVFNATIGNQIGDDGYMITTTVDEDFGDAPASYDPSEAASHIVGGLRLGSSADPDNTNAFNNVPATTPSPNAVAAGADNNGVAGDGADEDGLPIPLPTLHTGLIGQTYSLTPTLSGNGSGGQVCGWIDFNRNGVFDTAEGVCNTVGSGVGSTMLNWTVPIATTAGRTYVRLRATQGLQLSTATPAGRVDSGEVEDYMIEIKPAVQVVKRLNPTADTGRFDLAIGGSVFATDAGHNGTTGFRTLYHSSTSGPPDLTVAQNIMTTAITTTMSESPTAATTGTYASTYLCVNGAGAAVATGSGTSVNVTLPVSVTGAAANGRAQTVVCTFTNTLTAATPIATLTVAPASVVEGSGSLVYTVALDIPAPSALSVNLAPPGGTAMPGVDYPAIPTSVAIAAGASSGTVTVTPAAADATEADETVILQLASGVGYTIGSPSSATGTIIDPCSTLAFPYTLAGNTTAELIQAVHCANANATADIIDMNGQVVTFTNAPQFGNRSVLPEIQSDITIRNGTITRSGAQPGRFFHVTPSGRLTLDAMTVTNGAASGIVTDGGAIYLDAGIVTVRSSRLSGNSGAFGGAIFAAGGSTLEVVNSVLSGNRSRGDVDGDGGAIRNRGNTTLINSTVAGNWSPQNGGGIANAGAYTLTLRNSIVSGNEAALTAPEIAGAVTSISNTLVGGAPSFAAPLDASDTVPTTAGDYRLAAFSVAVDAGNNSLLPAGITTDVDGNPRRYDDPGVADTGVGTAPLVDLGAYERQVPSPYADIAVTNSDGAITAVPGTTHGYTITVTNAGPETAPSVSLSNVLPGALTGATWTAGSSGGAVGCGTNGVGSISTMFSLPVGAACTYAVTGTIDPAATGTLTHTASASVTGIFDPTPGNNSAPDTTTLTPQSDVGITLTPQFVAPLPPAGYVDAGRTYAYAIEVRNAGPSRAVDVGTLQMAFPSPLTDRLLANVVATDALCENTTGAFSGDLTRAIDTLGVGGSCIYIVQVTVPADGSGSYLQSNTLSFTPGFVDTTPGNDSASETRVILGATVVQTGGDTRVTEGGATDSLDIVLTGPPSANVTIALGGSQVTTVPAMLTFTPGNWSLPQTVTVTALDDFLVEGEHPGQITFVATSADPFFDAMPVPSVPVTITDNDADGVTLVQSGGDTAVTEGGANDTYTLVLTSEPTSPVTIVVSGDTQVAASPATLTFTAADWNLAQTVTATAVDDDVAEGTHGGTITHVASGSGYDAVIIPDVIVGIADDDAAGISVAPTAGLVTSESGSTATFDVVLDSEPTANVIVTLASSNTDEGTVSPAALTFTAADWDLPQTVTVTGIDDDIADGDIAYTIVVTASSADASYAAIDPADVAVVNGDDDAIGVVIVQSGGDTAVSEGGASDTYTVALASEPTGAVDIAITDDTQVATTPALLQFDASNWTIAQTVTVSAIDDAIAEGSHAGTITHVASGGGYDAVPIGAVAVTVTDNDDAGFDIAPSSGLVTTEAGGTATFAVALTSEPVAAVSIALSSSDASEASVAPTTLLFDAGNWNIAQTVTATGIDDEIADGDIGYSIVTDAAVSSDPAYAGIDPIDVAASNTDDDTPGVIVTPSAGLVTTEAGGTATFSIVLASEPSTDVTIGLTSSDAGEGSVAPSTVVFTPANWNAAQSVTVTGVDDDVVDGDVAYRVVTAAATSSDVNYAGVDPIDVDVVNTDDDSVGIVIVQTDGSTAVAESGATDSYTLALASEPTGNVQIAIATGTQLLASPPALAFTAADWNLPQTVTVSAIDDDVVEGDHVGSITHAATGGGYDGVVSAAFDVDIADNDTAGISITPQSGLVTTEAGGSATFSIVLGSAPAADVSVALTSSDIGEGTVVPSTVVFTPETWFAVQTVTVTGVDDAIVDGDIAYTIVTAPAVSADPNYAGLDAADVAVSNADDDAASLRIDDIGLAEGDSGTTAFVFTVTLDGAIEGGVQVDYTTGNDSAVAPDDYAAASGTLRFDGNDGETREIRIDVVGDTEVEADERFRVLLATPVSAQVTLARAEAFGTITNDDEALAALLAASKRVVQEGTTTQPVIYEIVLSNGGDGDQADDPLADELVDALPDGLAIERATASSGNVDIDFGTNTVRWNGALVAGASITLQVQAQVTRTQAGPIINQAIVHYDSDGDGSNDASTVSDDPTTAAPDATVFVFAGSGDAVATPEIIPTRDPRMLLLLVLVLALLGGVSMRRSGG